MRLVSLPIRAEGVSERENDAEGENEDGRQSFVWPACAAIGAGFMQTGSSRTLTSIVQRASVFGI